MGFLKGKEKKDDFAYTDENIYEEDKLEIARDCCDQIKDSSKRIVQAKKEYKAVNGYLNDIRILSELDDEPKEELVYCARRIMNLRSDKVAFKAYGARIPESKYQYIQMNEKELPEILKDLHDEEDYMQKLKLDLNNIEGEKAALKEERADFVRNLGYLKKGVGVILFITLCIIAGMAYFHLNSDYDFTIGFLLTSLIGLIIVAALVVSYQNNVRDIKITDKKMNKAIRLLNKHRLLFVNVKSRLDYMYEKIGIRDSYELNNYWRVYLTVKKEQQAYNKMSEELYQAQTNFSNLLSGLNLYDVSIWNGQLEAILDESVRKELVSNLEKQKKGLRKTLDYNQKQIEKLKMQVKKFAQDNPNLAGEILKIVEDKTMLFH